MAEALFSGFEEVWRVVPSIPGLMASSHGRIIRETRVAPMPHGGLREYVSQPTFGVIRRASRRSAYLYFGYYYLGIGNVKVHRLVCEAFHGAPGDASYHVMHLNENALDNRPENLRWGSRKENMSMPGFRSKCGWDAQARINRTIELCQFFGLDHEIKEAA